MHRPSAREVDDPGVLRGATGGQLGQLEDARDGPERLGEAAGPGRLLADDTEAQGQGLVDESGRLAAHPQLEKDEVGSVDGRVAVSGEGQSP